MPSRKGQTTIFLILGLAIFALAMLALIYAGSLAEKKSYRSVQDTLSDPAEEVRSYIEECLRKELTSLLYQQGRQGGQLTFQYSPLRRGEQRFGYAYSVLAKPPRVLPTTEQMRAELIAAIDPSFTACIDSFKPLKARNIQITPASAPEFAISINTKDVTIGMNYSLRIDGTASTTLTRFDAQLPANAGELAAIAESLLAAAQADPARFGEALEAIPAHLTVKPYCSYPSTLIIALSDESVDLSPIEGPYVLAIAFTFSNNKRPDYLISECGFA